MPTAPLTPASGYQGDFEVAPGGGSGGSTPGYSNNYGGNGAAGAVYIQ